MKLEKLSISTQDGLRLWAKFQHDDEMFFDGIGSSPTEWAWVLIQLKVTEDRPEWFPRGKSATLQVIEKHLLDLAKAETKPWTKGAGNA
jgi:hypothetical protein